MVRKQIYHITRRFVVAKSGDISHLEQCFIDYVSKHSSLSSASLAVLTDFAKSCGFDLLRSVSVVVELRNVRNDVLYASSAQDIDTALITLFSIIPNNLKALIEPYGKDFRKL